MHELITSFANPVVKRVRQLADRKNRRREGAFVVEGLQPVWRAVASGWPVDTVVVAPDLLVNEASRRMVEQQRDRGTRVVAVSNEVFVHLSQRQGPAGLAAIVRGTVGDLSAFRPRDDGPILGLYQPANPGNVGTIVRTADAAGAGGIALVGNCADPLAPAAVKASMGSVFAVPLCHTEDPDELLAWAAHDQRQMVAVTGSATTSVWDAAPDDRCVLLLGSEGSGLPEELAARCAASIVIPMRGSAESLNLASAAAVVLYELLRRRLSPAHPTAPPPSAPRAVP